ncbi:MAG: H4MPT-linked C1 transfer pathway protein [Planctomycetota bacterium]|nr:MAG: H4MPT-linked C1 transfer pathway protein [Planctomycetota bacterium]REK27311.1 MAG: H4MPT-linked C1 transfer pathway protein [Planctomycetota bacterium]REK36668.1 MAG: H4MPT-linked C1 transfer pathway protein [Planctomycetota bacterium]
MRVIGLDIGGANLKASDGETVSMSRPFPLWREPDRLAAALGDLLRSFNGFDGIAVTMTGELADCFTTKREGVAHILDAVREAAGGGAIVQVWQSGGEFVDVETARELTPLVAAANWHALAAWAGRMAPDGASLLIDIGSTTCDVIPIENGIPMPAGRTDPERLQTGELVYSGIWRTPVCVVVDSLPFRGSDVPAAAELFATMLDVYLLLGHIAEDPGNRETANGRSATVEAARDRMARMICADRDAVSLEDAQSMAAAVAQEQLHQIGSALERVLVNLTGPCQAVLTSGEGEFLARRLISSSASLADVTSISLAEALGREHSSAACAFALARLGRERVFSEQ